MPEPRRSHKEFLANLAAEAKKPQSDADRQRTLGQEMAHDANRRVLREGRNK
jgi:hypothetical protein